MEETKTSDNGTEVKEKKQSTEVVAAYNWIVPIIESCTNTFHMKCAKILVGKFKELYADKYGVVKYHDELVSKLIDRMDFIEIA